MKTFIYPFFALLIVFSACKNTPQYAGTAKKLTERNVSITPKNSYSDLFVDSSKVEQFITQQQLNDTIANDLRSFYNARNYQFAWFNSEGLTEQTLAFNSLYDYTEDSTKKALDRKLEDLMTDESFSPSATDNDIIKTELSITWRYINYCWNAYKDADERAEVLETSVPSQRMPILKMAEVVMKNKNQRIVSPSYTKLRDHLQSFVDSVKLLADTGSAKAKKDSLSFKIQQILVNMERAKWMPVKPEGKLIVVNIPEFKLHAKNGESEDFNMDVVVGKEGHNTVMFSGKLDQIVFSPYWNVPPSIVKKEILPSMDKNKNYLKNKNMEITGEENGLPVVRQLPGEKNDLGKVKFLFPNSFNIYFHDTPYKEIFNKEERAYSHGCIRLSDPQKMATYLLQDQKDWNSEKIIGAMNSGNEQYVKLKNPVPVLITYYTAWIDDNGALSTAKDIYNHDGKLAKRLFADVKHEN